MDMIKKTAIVAVIAMIGLPVYAANGNQEGGRQGGSRQQSEVSMQRDGGNMRHGDSMRGDRSSMRGDRGDRHDVSWRGNDRSERHREGNWRHRDGGDWRRGHHGRVIIDTDYGRYHRHHHRGNWVPGHWRYYTVCGSCRHCGCYEKRSWVPGHWVRW